jgi:hypothetical protein
MCQADQTLIAAAQDPSVGTDDPQPVIPVFAAAAETVTGLHA